MAGFMVHHYLLFGGNCQEALRTYEEAFGAEITELRIYGGYAVRPELSGRRGG